MTRFVLPAVLVFLTIGIGLILSAPLARNAVVVDQVWTGTAQVSDGDTIRIGEMWIRLHGIDTPERDQDCRSEHGFPFACGDAATDVLRARLAGQAVNCVHIEYDRYDRSVSRCYVDGADVGQEMVALGYAVAYRRYSTEYVPEEEAARAAGLGLWSANMQRPEVFRALQADTPPPPDPACAIKGNISDTGQIYHRPGQMFYDRTRINLQAGERWFCTEAEAQAAGWRPARR